MQHAKDKIIALWLHLWLKRIAKRFPEFFEQLLTAVSVSDREAQIMRARYIHHLKFKQIPDVVNVELRQVYKIHQNIIDRLINL